MAAEITISTADFDRWMYPFNGTPGFRNAAPTFSAVGAGAFDNMDGQFLVGFDTATAGIGPLGPGEMFVINSVRVTATHSTGAFAYDPTFDSYASHLEPSDPNFVADTDTGRPIELYGVGLRGEYSSLGFAGGVTAPPTFNDGSPFAFSDPTLPGVRNAYAFDTTYGDVSNAVDDELFSVMPWAIGQAPGLSPGDVVPQGVAGVSAGQTFEFEIDLGRPDVYSYIEDGLGDGGLFFSIVSLHSTGMSGGSNPNFYTADNFDPAAIAPSLVIDFEIVPVPEPATMTLGLLASATIASVVAGRRLSRSRQNSRRS